MISDDDVIRVFEQADPARRPDRVNHRLDGAGYLATLRPRGISVTLTESQQTESQQTDARPSRRWAFAGAAAAAVAVIVGGLVLLAQDDTPPSTPFATNPAGSAAKIDVVEEFVRAVNDRDLALMDAVSTDGLTFDALPVEELPSLMAWYEAFDWRWEDATCTTTSPGADVRCELFERNRLTDLTGAERPATVWFVMIDDEVEAVTVAADLSDYSPNAFEPFRDWVETNHPDDVTRMWTNWDGPVGPVLTADAAALFDQHLNDFARTSVVEEFVRAVNDRDLALMDAVSTDGLTFDGDVAVDTLPVEELPSLMAWYEAFDWRWEDATCTTSSPGADVRCELFERNRLTDLTGADRPATVSFVMIDDEVEAVTVAADLSDYSPNAFRPFRDWVEANHPDDVTRMWTSRNRPVLTADAAALFDQHLSDFADDYGSTIDE